MPIYEYQCAKCNRCFEKLVFGSSPEVLCPQCGSKETRKCMSRFGMGKSSGDASASSSSSGGGCSGCSSSSCSSCT